MSAVPFDTLKFVEKLEAGGISHAQAKATAEAFAEATSQQLATKADLELAVSKLEGTQRLHSWMLGFLIAGVLSLLGGVGSLILKIVIHT